MFFGFARCLGHWNWWFLHRVIGSLSVANHFYYFLFTNLDADDFSGLYLFAGPRAILECYEGRTIEPLQIPSYVLDVAYEGFLLKPLNKILKDRNPFTPYGHSFRHSILDRIIGENDPCKLASLGLVMDAYVMISLGQHCGSPTAQLDLYNKTSKLPLQLHRSRLSSPYLTMGFRRRTSEARFSYVFQRKPMDEQSRGYQRLSSGRRLPYNHGRDGR